MKIRHYPKRDKQSSKFARRDSEQRSRLPPCNKKRFSDKRSKFKEQADEMEVLIPKRCEPVFLTSAHAFCDRHGFELVVHYNTANYGDDDYDYGDEDYD